MPATLPECAEHVRRLHEAVVELERASTPAQVAPLAGREWFEVLTRKLVPQLSADAFLVVAVVGGTNIGKSVIFNHIAGFRASATSPLASGTKHPTCLVPEGFTDAHDLAAIFPGFELRAWSSAEETLVDTPEHGLYWRVSGDSPDNLLVLDTPDIDSDARVNWERADRVRQCADVLVAVLTQQKYNDAAVKEFFRKAAAEDKAVLIVFNQCQLPDDEEYWPLWLETFCRETQIAPELVYVAPNDRRAAEEMRLGFYERAGASRGERAESRESQLPTSDFRPPTDVDAPRSLLADLSQLRFFDIKVRTLRGALRLVADSDAGVPAWLREIEASAEEYRGAAALLAAHELAEIGAWPQVSGRALVGEIREWWRLQREGWSAKVHGFYNSLGHTLTWPVRYARDRIQGPVIPPLEVYRHKEWAAVLDAVEKVYRKLEWLSELGNELLRPRLEKVLAGTSRAELLQRIHEAHARFDLEAELRQLVADELADFRSESPQHYEFFKRLDTLAAAARPATSVILFVAGFGPVGHAITPVLTDTVLQGVVHAAGDVAGGTIAAAVGDAVISEGAATSAGYLEAKFRKLQAAFTRRRAQWLAGLLQQHLLGTLPEDLQHAASVAGTEEFQRVRSLARELREAIPVEAESAVG
jgi:hypothetical protein